MYPIPYLYLFKEVAHLPAIPVSIRNYTFPWSCDPASDRTVRIPSPGFAISIIYARAEEIYLILFYLSLLGLLVLARRTHFTPPSYRPSRYYIANESLSPMSLSPRAPVSVTDLGSPRFRSSHQGQGHSTSVSVVGFGSAFFILTLTDLTLPYLTLRECQVRNHEATVGDGAYA